MKIIPSMSVEPEKAEGVDGVTIRWVIDKNTGAPNFAMRIFDIQPGSNTPLHRHDWEHEIYVLEGEGAAVAEDGEHPVRTGDAVFVPGGDLHSFRNTSGGLLRVMCLIPLPD